MTIEFKKGFECWLIDSEYKYHGAEIDEDGSKIEFYDSIFTISELEQILIKMKELKDDDNIRNKN